MNKQGNILKTRISLIFKKYVYFSFLEEFVMLQTHNYGKSKLSTKLLVNYTNYESYETRSTTTINDHRLIDSVIKYSRMYMVQTKPSFARSSLYRKINDLFRQMAIMSLYAMCANNYSSFFYSIILPFFFLFFCYALVCIHLYMCVV
jgi:hypothetical protein